MPVVWLGLEYRIQQINGQCIITEIHQQCMGGHLREVFVRGIPRNYGPDELIPIFSKPGMVHSMRLLMEYDGCNRGLAYVSYVDPRNIYVAISQLHGLAISTEHRLQLYRSLNYRSCYLINVAPSYTPYALREMIAHLTHSHAFRVYGCCGQRNDVKIVFDTHPNSIRAIQKLNHYRLLFGQHCIVVQARRAEMSLQYVHTSVIP